MIKGKPLIKLFKCLLNYLFFIRMNKTKLYVSCVPQSYQLKS